MVVVCVSPSEPGEGAEEAEEAEGTEEEDAAAAAAAARWLIPGGSAKRRSLCKRLHTKLMGSRWGPYSGIGAEGAASEVGVAVAGVAVLVVS